MASNADMYLNDSSMDNDSFDYTVINNNESVNSIEESKKNLVGYLEVVFAILLLVCNLFIVCVILASKKLRCSSKHLLILNLSFVDMIKVFALAINVYLKFSGSSAYECDLQYISRLITDLTTGLSGVFIFLLHIDYIASSNTTSLYPGRRLVGPVLLAFFSYIVTGAVLVPIYVLHLQPEQYDISTGNCWPFSTEGTFLLYEGLAVVPQNLLILVSGGMTIGAYISRSYLLNISKELNLVRRPVDLNIAGAITVVLHSVAYLYHIVDKLICVGVPCSDMTGWDIIIPLLPFIKCVILPFVWLLCPDFRTALSICCTKRQKHVKILLTTDIEKEEATGSNSKETPSKSPALKAKAYSDVIEELKNENSKDPKQKSKDKTESNSKSPKLKEKKDSAVVDVVPNQSAPEKASTNASEITTTVDSETGGPNESFAKVGQADEIATVEETDSEKPEESQDVKRETYVIDQVPKESLDDMKSSPKVETKVIPVPDATELQKNNQTDNESKTANSELSASVTEEKPAVLVSPHLELKEESEPETGEQFPDDNAIKSSDAQPETAQDIVKDYPIYPEPYKYQPDECKDPSTDHSQSNPDPSNDDSLDDYNLNSQNDKLDDFDPYPGNVTSETLDQQKDQLDEFDRYPRDDSFDESYPAPDIDNLDEPYPLPDNFGDHYPIPSNDSFDDYPSQLDDDWNMSKNYSESFQNDPDSHPRPHNDNLNGYPAPPSDLPEIYPPGGRLNDGSESNPHPPTDKAQPDLIEPVMDDGKEKVVMV